MHKNCCIGLGAIINKPGFYNNCIYIKRYSNTTDSDEERIKSLVMQAFYSAREDAGIKEEEIRGNKRVGLVIGTSLGDMESLEMDLKAHLYEGADETCYLNEFIMDSAINHLRKKLNLKGPTYLLSNTCVSSFSAIQTALNLLDNNSVDLCFVGGVEIVSDYINKGLESLKVVSRTNEMRPFGKERNGMVLTESAGFLVLAEEKPENKSFSYYGDIKACIIGNDISERPLYTDAGVIVKEIIKTCLKEAGLSFNKIDCIYSSANGTKMNDKIQASVISELSKYYEYDVPVSTFKPIYGHTLGAAGIIESIGVFQSMKMGKILGNIDYEIDNAFDTINLNKNRNYERESRNCMLLSYGIHRVNGAVIMGKE